MNRPSFLGNLKKNPNQSSTPVLSQYQANRPISQNYLHSQKDEFPSQRSINIENKIQQGSHLDSKGLKPNFLMNSPDRIPSTSPKYTGTNAINATNTPTKKYGAMKTSHILPQKRDIQLTADTIASNSDKKTKRAPRVSMPNSFADMDNQYSEQHSINDKSNEETVKEQHFGKKKSVINDNSAYKQRMMMRKSSTDFITRNWQIPTIRKPLKKQFSLNDFDQIKDLGAGKYGKVFMVREKVSNMVFALKIIQKKLLVDQEITQQFIRELKIQLFLNHPNIIKMYGFFDDKTNIYIILQAGMGGQLFKQLKKNNKLSQQKAATYMRQICQAVNQLHSYQIIHRDIKPQNIVLHQNIIKLCDFGWSVYRDQKLRSTFCGTPLYVCPQILRGKDYDEKIDIWSLGVMMYEMLVGENPFKITKQQDLVNIVKQNVQFPQSLSAEAQDFLNCCLQKKPQNRKNIRELLNHSFFKKYPQRSQKKMGI